MEDKLQNKTVVRVDTGAGIFWFSGWLFTIAYAELLWWEAIIALLGWPYYLGLALK